MLGDERPHRWQLEHLATLDVDELGIGQVTAAATARRGRVHAHVVGDLHLGQVLALGPGLFARASLCGTSFSPIGDRGLSEPLGRRRHRRVARVPAQSLLEICDTCSLFADEPLELDDAGLLRSNEFGQLLIQGRAVNRRGIVGWNSQRYARRSPRWWTRRSGGLNSYDLAS